MRGTFQLSRERLLPRILERSDGHDLHHTRTKLKYDAGPVRVFQTVNERDDPMKRFIAASMLVGALAGFTGCRQITAVAPAGEAGKVYVTKITSYIFFVSNKVQSCSIAGTAVTGCTDISVE
jgi:hypothetical protein